MAVGGTAGRRTWRGAVAAGLLGLILAAGPAAALSVEIVEEGVGTLAHTATIRLSGPIEAGDADRLAREVGRIRFGNGSRARVLLDSPGGSLVEGMAIGRVLAAMPTTVMTDVGGRGDRAADCASACVLAFLGGHYRYLRAGSRLGVHQFYSSDEAGMTGAEGIALGQVLSAEIVDYMAEMRVDPAFLRLMTEPSPEEIRWVPRAELERVRVVTGDIYDQRSEYRNADGFYYLTLWQQSVFGENKLLVTCNEIGGIGAMAYLQPPDLQAAKAAEHDLRITIDGTPELPQSWDMIGTDDRWAIAVLAFTDDQVARLGRARSVGARLYPEGGDWFYGFDYALEDRALSDMIEGCRLRGLDTTPPDPTAVAGPESAPAPAAATPGGMTVLPGRAFGGEGPALPAGSFEECEAICLADRGCDALTFTPATGICRPLAEPGTYAKAVGSISALRP